MAERNFLKQSKPKMMTESIEKQNSLKSNNKAFTLSNAPELYNKLLSEYVDLLSKHPFNPYQSFLRILIKSFNPFFIRKFWLYTKKYLKIPNTLPYDLIGAKEILTRLEPLDDRILIALYQSNNINLRHITKRCALSWINKIAIVLASLAGLNVTIEKLFSTDIFTEIVKLLPWLDFFRDMVGSLIAGLVIGGIINIIISIPKIGLIRAFGEIISIAKVYRRIE